MTNKEHLDKLDALVDSHSGALVGHGKKLTKNTTVLASVSEAVDRNTAELTEQGKIVAGMDKTMNNGFKEQLNKVEKRQWKGNAVAIATLGTLVAGLVVILLQ
jgi:hypothetical protein